MISSFGLCLHHSLRRWSFQRGAGGVGLVGECVMECWKTVLSAEWPVQHFLKFVVLLVPGR